MAAIRFECSADFDQIRELNDEAFEGPAEGMIVDTLRVSDPNAFSMVAVEDEMVVGHIFFSTIKVESPNGIVTGMGLAPLAVHADYRHQGIGSDLIRSGLRHIENLNMPFVIVLGHEDYYPRFGFVPASRYDLYCQWPGVPDGAFLVIICDHLKMKGVSGIARYRDEFNAAM